ncbi:Protein GLUTAMINE DUMPER 4 [Raphanus sativus]|uniref:Protein GLUTAMINE DUMPER 4 n=1 Tax=Raphanus sativus TaxID=3726 RepID=A0A6J0JSQ1_RAPSA|nr:protein GLUTAMINE DUMPER 4 [Raphanus sativus]KAJ4890669.1 Protein GLUTAMINE DUMPER 4 [Raphanus sativus]
MRSLSIKPTSLDASRHATSVESFGNHQPPQSPSPVPYLFGGLAAMLGLIAFALLILACSYWHLTISDEDFEEGNGRGADEEKESRSGEKAAYEEKYIVIMAGDDLPTYLATPAGNKCVCSHEGEVIFEEGDAAKREETRQNEEATSH